MNPSDTWHYTRLCVDHMPTPDADQELVEIFRQDLFYILLIKSMCVCASIVFVC